MPRGTAADDSLGPAVLRLIDVAGTARDTRTALWEKSDPWHRSTMLRTAHQRDRLTDERKQVLEEWFAAKTAAIEAQVEARRMTRFDAFVLGVLPINMELDVQAFGFRVWMAEDERDHARDELRRARTFRPDNAQVTEHGLGFRSPAGYELHIGQAWKRLIERALTIKRSEDEGRRLYAWANQADALLGAREYAAMSLIKRYGVKEMLKFLIDCFEAHEGIGDRGKALEILVDAFEMVRVPNAYPQLHAQLEQRSSALDPSFVCTLPLPLFPGDPRLGQGRQPAVFASGSNEPYAGHQRAESFIPQARAPPPAGWVPHITSLPSSARPDWRIPDPGDHGAIVPHTTRPSLQLLTAPLTPPFHFAPAPAPIQRLPPFMHLHHTAADGEKERSGSDEAQFSSDPAKYAFSHSSQQRSLGSMYRGWE
ncbi:hypothetical protein JCM10908_005955 [Rhodotorula pacifica]|uniref:uncharacterized protein n=1 Tax=Rhodotorula pacifica TaxID=1495444 RepID=UPI003180BE2A